MEFKQVIDNFKATHVQAGKQMGFSLLPLLVQELIKNGLDVSHMPGKFYQELAIEIFGSNIKIQSHAVDALALLTQIVPLPATNPEMGDKSKVAQKRVTVPSVIIEDDIVKTEHLVDNIPDEDEEGDGLYTPPEESLTLSPDDIEPTQRDEEFCRLIGATRYLNK